MKTRTLKTKFFLIVVLSLIYPSAESMAGGGARPIWDENFPCSEQVDLEAGWNSIRDRFWDCYELPSVSLRGRGEVSNKEYELHLIRYHQRRDTYVGLLTVEDQTLASAGFLVQQESGTFFWFPLNLRSQGSSVRVEPLIGGRPSFVLTLEIGQDDRLQMITAAGGGSERLRFEHASAPRLQQNLERGRWHAVWPQNTGCTLVTTPNLDMGLNPVWNAVSNCPDESNNEVLRAVFPGVFEVRRVGRENYEDTVSPRIYALAFNLQAESESRMVVLPVSTAGAATSPAAYFYHRE